MIDDKVIKPADYRPTRLALLWMNISSEPLLALYTLFPFILRKDLHVSAFELSLFISLKPVLSVFSFYWNAYQTNKGRNLLSNVMSTWILAYVPFLFYPFLDNYWYFLFAAGCYQLFSKAATPSFMEILKQNIPRKPRESLFSLSHIICFIESSIFGVVMGKILDQDGSSWKLLSVMFAFIALTSLLIQRRIPRCYSEASNQLEKKDLLLGPLKQSFQLMKNNPEFKDFQMGFMIGGSALMFMAPALAIFYADILQLSHESISNARFIFMTIGVALSSFLWRKTLERFSLNQLMPWVTIGFGLFPIFLLLAYFNATYLSVAFLTYGIAQAGSHLIWHLSGTIFSQEKESISFTAVNILLQGIRGMTIPLLGGIFCSLVGAIPVLLFGSAACFYGVWIMFKNVRRHKKTSNPQLS